MPQSAPTPQLDTIRNAEGPGPRPIFIRRCGRSWRASASSRAEVESKRRPSESNPRSDERWLASTFGGTPDRFLLSLLLCVAVSVSGLVISGSNAHQVPGPALDERSFFLRLIFPRYPSPHSPSPPLPSPSRCSGRTRSIYGHVVLRRIPPPSCRRPSAVRPSGLSLFLGPLLRAPLGT
ncbi:hypothetical protein F5148DRAFT_451804 [Russula earlei]|uniref:Uncharacterized protein n=1 Tax=Russula earlei TaxID=71964 RepID=A0ACC0U074_9AGAM|nr:hypothetical protein F5148DRAFT_451804 [Russula earlei]